MGIGMDIGMEIEMRIWMVRGMGKKDFFGLNSKKAS
jgi:hypothetical protein